MNYKLVRFYFINFRQSCYCQCYKNKYCRHNGSCTCLPSAQMACANI